jgi:hypothetical protein
MLQIKTFTGTKLEAIENEVNEYLEMLSEDGVDDCDIDILCNTQYNDCFIYYTYTIVYSEEV